MKLFKPTPAIIKLLALSLTGTSALVANTTLISSSVYSVTASTAFTTTANGSSDYLFSWTDADSDSFSNIADPTLILTVGETYTFQRSDGLHPLVLTTDALPVTGTDGSFARSTSDLADITDNQLTPTEDFTADPAPTSDLITWTPTVSDLGTYYYTCLVQFHSNMTGQLQVVPEPSAYPTIGGLLGLSVALWRRNSGPTNQGHPQFRRTDYGGAPRQLHARVSQQTNTVARTLRSSFDPDSDRCPN